MIESEREIRVHTEMAGLKRENMEIDVENNVLTIRGEKQEERAEGEQGKYHVAERRYGTFARSFVLPRDVGAENIQADFREGVLTVTIPKSEKARRRRIEVGGSSKGAQAVGSGSAEAESQGGRSKRGGSDGGKNG